MKTKRKINERRIRLAKVVIVIIPILIVAYLITQQFLIPKEFTYFYDIGSEQDKNYLTPNYRITEILDDETTYRNLTSGLVYFYIVPPRGYEEVFVEAKIKDNFPDKQKMSIGIRDNQSYWHYKYHNVYNYTEETRGEWIIVSTTFTNEDNMTLLKNGQLSLLFNTPHLSRNETSNYTIPIDWISIRVYKPGVFER